MIAFNPRPLIVCSVLAVPCIAAGVALRDRQPEYATIGDPQYVVAPAVAAAAVPEVLPPTPSSQGYGPTAVPVAASTQSADRGIRLQITETVPAPTLPRHPHHDIWIRLAECESGGDWSINTGNSYYGGVQFSLTSWRGVGGTGWPHQASVWEQMYRAERLLDIQGWGAWPSCSRQLGLR